MVKSFECAIALARATLRHQLNDARVARAFVISAASENHDACGVWVTPSLPGSHANEQYCNDI